MKNTKQHQFAMAIERVVKDGKGKVLYMEAILNYADVYGLDEKKIKRLMNDSLMDKLTTECRDLNLIDLPSSGKLPL